jgi:hypothetical protein
MAATSGARRARAAAAFDVAERCAEIGGPSPLPQSPDIMAHGNSRPPRAAEGQTDALRNSISKLGETMMQAFDKIGEGVIFLVRKDGWVERHVKRCAAKLCGFLIRVKR